MYTQTHHILRFAHMIQITLSNLVSSFIISSKRKEFWFFKILMYSCSSADFRGWFRLRGNSREAFDIIVFTKPVFFFNFDFRGGVWGLQSSSLPPLKVNKKKYFYKKEFWRLSRRFVFGFTPENTSQYYSLIWRYICHWHIEILTFFICKYFWRNKITFCSYARKTHNSIQDVSCVLICLLCIVASFKLCCV